ncbi:ion channel [uncultured Roseobacter sp.]|uniref:ion channel n=1 Tax=uncultured Roseobacter sp. TaxID=114847 RepID=UPI00261C4617|nr:ion channel [uncultured Roseobacter sp.]
MLVLIQILIGSFILLVCALIHIMIIARMIRHLASHDHFAAHKTARHQLVTLCVLFLITLLSHTIQLYFCALMLWLVGALQGYEEPIYFSLVTYTTLGYGDVVLTPQFRILGAMISVTGIVMFGMTTAFLVGLFGRILGEKTP